MKLTSKYQCWTPRGKKTRELDLIKDFQLKREKKVKIKKISQIQVRETRYLG